MASYLELLDDTYKKRKWALSQAAEKKIVKAYDSALKDIAADLKKPGNELRKSYLEGRMQTLYKDLDSMAQTSVTDAAKLATEYHSEVFKTMGFDSTKTPQFSTLFAGIPMETLKMMESGKLYKDGLGLSQRLWLQTKQNGKDVERIIKDGMLKGTDSRKIADILTGYISPGAKTPWPNSRVRELLGYTPKRTIDYNAMRLARTSISHAYSLTNRTAAEKNPFVKGYIWHSAFAHNRTCAECKERDGQFFSFKDLPYDHPNGMCWEEPSIEGSIENISKQIGDWVGGKPDKMLDSWWKNNAPRTPSNKVVEAVKEVKELTSQAVSSLIDNISKVEPMDLNKYKIIKQSQVAPKAKGFYKNLKQSDLDAIGEYVANGGSFDINRFLYSGDYVGYKTGAKVADNYSKEMIDIIDKFSNVINRNTLGTDSMLIRNVDSNFLENVLDQIDSSNVDLHGMIKNLRDDPNFKEADSIVKELNKSMSGAEYVNEGFTSTSYDQKKNIFKSKVVHMKVYADKDTKVLLTNNFDEAEIVLDKGTKFEILGFKAEERPNTDYKIVMEVYVVK